MMDSILVYSMEQVDDLRKLLAKAMGNGLDFPITICVSPAQVMVEALPAGSDNMDGGLKVVRLEIEKKENGKKSVAKSHI